MKKTIQMALGLGLVATLSSCGGGGGGGSYTPDPIDVINYPYETVYGDTCKTSEITPGCTFLTSTGKRATVSKDPHYDRYGYGSDDMWFVKFDGSGNAKVYDQDNNLKAVKNRFGVLTYYPTVADFAGYIHGTVIGVGTTGSFWENVANGTYWLGKTGVLYSANQKELHYGEAINNKNSSSATNANLVVLRSKANQELIKAGAKTLQEKWGFQPEKAMAVAKALNTFGVMGARGQVTNKDMDKTFTAVFGVEFSKAVSAVKAYVANDKTQIRELTNRSAAALGLKPHQAQDFIKGMYRQAFVDY